MQAQCQAPVAVTSTTADPTFEETVYKSKIKHLTLPDGTSLAYTDTGKGLETIIFIHGLGSYLQAWNKNIDELSKSYRTIAIDLPGYGESTKEGVEISMVNYAKAVLELMKELHLEHTVLAGHSMGGQIAITVALQAPERISKVILAAPAGFETFSEQQKQLLQTNITPEIVQQTTPEQITAYLKANFHLMPADAQFMIEDRLKLMSSNQLEAYSKAVAGSVAAMVDEPVANHLNKLNMPVLILFGEKDALIPNKRFNPDLSPATVADAGAKKIKHSQIILLPEAGHFLQYEQPALFNKAVIEFFN